MHCLSWRIFILNNIENVDDCLQKCDDLTYQGEHQCQFIYYDERKQKCGLFKECARTATIYETIFKVWERTCSDLFYIFVMPVEK